MGHALIDVTSGGDVLIDLILVVDDLHVLCYMSYVDVGFYSAAYYATVLIDK